MDFERVRNELAAVLDDPTLFDPQNLQARNQAVDLIKYADGVLQVARGTGDHSADGLASVYAQAQRLTAKLEAVNDALFQQVREDIKNRRYSRAGLRTFLEGFTDRTPWKAHKPEYEYDGLDQLLEQVLFPEPPPTESAARDPGMIRYEATTARIVLELVDSISFTAQDVFYDIGSGLGLVVMLVTLLTGTRCVGVEYDPVYCEYARRQIKALRLDDITILNGDARETDLNEGTVFYLFTPFVNEVFDRVLERLRYTALRHPIYLCAYGTITRDLMAIPWLQLRDPAMDDEWRLAVFTSK